MCTIKSTPSRDPEKYLKHITHNTISTKLSESPKIPHTQIISLSWLYLGMDPPVMRLGEDPPVSRLGVDPPVMCLSEDPLVSQLRLDPPVLYLSEDPSVS